MVFTIVSRTQTHRTFLLLSKNKSEKREEILWFATLHTLILVYVAVKFNFLPTHEHTHNIFFNFGYPLPTQSLFCTFHHTHCAELSSFACANTCENERVCESVFLSITSKQKPNRQLTVQIVIGICFVLFFRQCVCGRVRAYVQCDGFLYQANII